MADQKRKIETIRIIENLQLSTVLIRGLDDAQQAEAIAEAVSSLQGLVEQWN
jgi:pyruvate-formate lyase-activating enzyme